jgi:hypothetical protein
MRTHDRVHKGRPSPISLLNRLNLNVYSAMTMQLLLLKHVFAA